MIHIHHISVHIIIVITIYVMTVMSLDTYYIANNKKKVISFIRSVISIQPQG